MVSFANATTINVKDFGAVGNGVADDTSAIQAAFNTAGDVFIPAGTYRVTSTLTLPFPFKVAGAGAGTTVLKFEGMGGFSGSTGISIAAGGVQATGSMSDLTLAIKGAHGGSAIASPRGSTTTPPTYVFERMKFQGDVEQDLQGLYDYGWNRCFDIGDGEGHLFRDILFFGSYDYRLDPFATDSGASAVAIYLSGVSGEGEVLRPVIDHCFTHYIGTSVEYGYRVNSPSVVKSQFHRGFRGIYSPKPMSTPENYGVENAKIHTLNINSQLECITFAKTDHLDIHSVRATRADAAFDHGNTWSGFKFDGVYDLNVANTRAYNTASAGVYSGAHVGIDLEDCDSVYISGYNCRLHLDYGVILEDTTRVAVLGSTFFWPEDASFYFRGNTTNIAISADLHASTTPYDAEAGFDYSRIYLIPFDD